MVTHRALGKSIIQFLHFTFGASHNHLKRSVLEHVIYKRDALYAPKFAKVLVDQVLPPHGIVGRQIIYENETAFNFLQNLASMYVVRAKIRSVQLLLGRSPAYFIENISSR